MANRTVNITVGSQYFDVTGYTYYGYDSGPSLYYGSIDPVGIVGADNKAYTVHGVRWAAESPNNRVYLRLDNPTITSSQSYTAYTSLFTSIKIGSTTLSASNIVSGFTVNGGVAFYWNVPSNPFGSVGSVTSVLFSGVNSGLYGLQIFDSSGTKKVEISSALIAVAGIDSVTIAANSSIQVNIPELNNSGVWKVFLDGFPYSGSNPIYTAVINPSVAYFNGYYTLTNNNTSFSWAGTAFVYRVS